MKLSDAVICWSPNQEKYPMEVRGKLRIFSPSVAHAEIAPFACRAGHFDPQTLDPRLEARQAYALKVAKAMTERDDLAQDEVHAQMLGVEEYASGIIAFPNPPWRVSP